VTVLRLIIHGVGKTTAAETIYTLASRRYWTATGPIPMASDSESSHTDTHSQGFSPLLGYPEALPPQRTTKASMGGILSPSSARRRTSVKGDRPSLLKRAVSSPNVRDLANLDTSAMSSAEKKRNKLGYHRTSVACGMLSSADLTLGL